MESWESIEDLELPSALKRPRTPDLETIEPSPKRRRLDLPSRLNLHPRDLDSPPIPPEIAAQLNFPPIVRDVGSDPPSHVDLLSLMAAANPSESDVLQWPTPEVMPTATVQSPAYETFRNGGIRFVCLSDGSSVASEYFDISEISTPGEPLRYQTQGIPLTQLQDFVMAAKPLETELSPPILFLSILSEIRLNLRNGWAVTDLDTGGAYCVMLSPIKGLGEPFDRIRCLVGKSSIQGLGSDFVSENGVFARIDRKFQSSRNPSLEKARSVEEVLWVYASAARLANVQLEIGAISVFSLGHYGAAGDTQLSMNDVVYGIVSRLNLLKSEVGGDTVFWRGLSSAVVQNAPFEIVNTLRTRKPKKTVAKMTKRPGAEIDDDGEYTCTLQMITTRQVHGHLSYFSNRSETLAVNDLAELPTQRLRRRRRRQPPVQHTTSSEIHLAPSDSQEFLRESSEGDVNCAGCRKILSYGKLEGLGRCRFCDRFFYDSSPECGAVIVGWLQVCASCLDERSCCFCKAPLDTDSVDVCEAPGCTGLYHLAHGLHFCKKHISTYGLKYCH